MTLMPTGEKEERTSQECKVWAPAICQIFAVHHRRCWAIQAQGVYSNGPQGSVPCLVTTSIEQTLQIAADSQGTRDRDTTGQSQVSLGD